MIRASSATEAHAWPRDRSSAIRLPEVRGHAVAPGEQAVAPGEQAVATGEQAVATAEQVVATGEQVVLAGDSDMGIAPHWARGRNPGTTGDGDPALGEVRPVDPPPC